MKKKIIGIDAGSEHSGLVILEEGNIKEGYNMDNKAIFGFICNESEGFDTTIVIEDVRPYNMRITNGIIDTVKFIGQIEWRLRDRGFVVDLIPRWQVKQWIFIQFKPFVEPLIEKKIDTAIKNKIKQGKEIKYRARATFVWVDDRTIVQCMRKWWKIEKVRKVGDVTPYNLREHSWQALALVSFYLQLN